MTTEPTPSAPPTPSPNQTLATPLSTSSVFYTLLFIGIVLCAIYFFHTWLSEHDARLKAEASVAIEQKSIDQAAVEVKQLQDAQKERDAQTAAAIEKITEAAAAQKTPQQITNWIPTQLGALPEPVKSSIAPATAASPTPPAIITIPQVDLAPVRDLIAQGQECAAKLPSELQDLSSCQAQAKLAQQQLAAAEEQRDAYKEELKGGTFWRRVKHDLKVTGISVGAAALAICASGHCK
jgi:flagellar biosynthesis chaperone FliJ